MEEFLFKPVEWARRYNCSWYSVDTVPLEARRAPYLGSGFMALSTFYLLCYLPCAMVIGRHLEHSCYKLMFVLAWCDIAALANYALVGYFAIRGMVFCSAPTLMFTNCGLAYMFWIVETSLTVVLALNRCLDLLAPVLASVWYDGWRAWYWVALVVGFALGGLFFANGCSFSALLFTYIHNPHAGYYDEWYKDEAYHGTFQPTQNIFVLVALIALYTILLLGLKWKRTWHRSAAVTPAVNNAFDAAAPIAAQQGGWERRIFLQVAVICAVNATVVCLFVIFHRVAVPPWLIYVAMYGLLSVHGSPGLVYITFNQTIRGDCKEMFFKLGKKFFPVRSGALGGTNQPTIRATAATGGGGATLAAGRLDPN